MSEKKRDTSKKRNAIIDAALHAFRDEGYETTSMDRIAELAKASKRTVYNHFPSKEVLFQTVVDRFMDELCSLKQIPYDSGRSLEGQLLEFAEAKVKLMKNPSWQGLVKVALGVFIKEPAIAEETLGRAEADAHTLVLWLREASADGRLQVDDPELAAEMFWGMVSGALFWPQMFQDRVDGDRMERLKKEIVRAFLAAYRARESGEALPQTMSSRT